MGQTHGISLEEVNVFFGSSWIEVSKSADRIFFPTKLLCSPLVSLCFDNRNVMKNKPHSSKKKQLLATDIVGSLKIHLKGLR